MTNCSEMAKAQKSKWPRWLARSNFVFRAVAKSETLFRFIRWLHRFDEAPHYNRWGAGLYQLLWTRYCGYDWAHARKCAFIYWRSK